jgi:hypothetical protein
VVVVEGQLFGTLLNKIAVTDIFFHKVKKFTKFKNV